MRVHSDAMQFQMAILGPPTNRHKQFLKLWDGSLRGPASPGQAVKCEVMLFDCIQLCFSLFYLTKITYLGPTAISTEPTIISQQSIYQSALISIHVANRNLGTGSGQTHALFHLPMLCGIILVDVRQIFSCQCFTGPPNQCWTEQPFQNATTWCSKLSRWNICISRLQLVLPQKYFETASSYCFSGQQFS